MPASHPGLGQRLRELAGIDSRSLALLRIGMASILLLDLVMRSRFLRDHYSDWGVLPRAAVADWLPLRTKVFPLYFVDGSAWWAGLLFAVTGAAALCLLLGWRTRLATIACWALVSALQIRMPSVLHGGDNLLRILLVWSIFLPLGASWSLDARRKGERRPLHVVSMATLAIQLQLCFMYVFTALRKSDPVWTEERSAVLIALNLDYLTTSWGAFLRGFPALLEIATAATLALELLGPLLLWLPFFIGPLRFFVALAFVLFHLAGLAPALELGSFPWVCAVAWSIFLPRWFWERVRWARSGAGVLESDGLSFRARPSQVAQNLVVLLLLVTTLSWNLRDLSPERFSALVPRGFDPVVQCLGLQQSWRMFAPRPPADDGWFVAPAARADGSTVDAWSLAPFDPRRPDDVAATYMGARWTKYLINLTYEDYLTHRPLFTSYLCRRFNDRHDRGGRIERLEAVFMREVFDPASGDSGVEPRSLGVQICPAGP